MVAYLERLPIHVLCNNGEVLLGKKNLAQLHYVRVPRHAQLLHVSATLHPLRHLVQGDQEVSAA